MNTCLRGVAIAASLVFMAQSALAADHPLIGRYQGSEQVGDKTTEYDETYMITGPVVESPRDVNGPGWSLLEGKIRYLYYKVPSGISALAMQRNFVENLKANGVSIVLDCAVSKGDCFTSGKPQPGVYLALLLDTPVNMPPIEGRVVRNVIKDDKARYIYGYKDEDGGRTHISMAISGGTELPGYVIVKVVENAQMPTSQIVVVGADKMQQALAENGLVNLYGITFEFDKADIRPESAAQIQQIADLLAADPGLMLDVVGHTDNQGGADYNLDLSNRRAQAVVAALVGQYGVDAARLTPVGKGLQQPVASNESEEGRLQNRRVELLRR